MAHGRTRVLEILIAVKAIILQRSKQIQGLLRVTQWEMPDLRLKCNAWSRNDRSPHPFLARWPLRVGIPWFSPSVPCHLAPGSCFPELSGGLPNLEHPPPLLNKLLEGKVGLMFRKLKHFWWWAWVDNKYVLTQKGTQRIAC